MGLFAGQYLWRGAAAFSLHGIGSEADDAVEVLYTVSQAGHKIAVARLHDLGGSDIEVECPAFVNPEMEAQVVVPYSPCFDQWIKTLLDVC